MVAAETSEGVLTANEIRRFLLHSQASETPSTTSRDASSSPPAKPHSGPSGARGADGDQTVVAANPERLKEIELDEMLSALDLDGDGKIKMEDFLRLLLVPQEVSSNDEGSPESSSQRRGRPFRRCSIL